MSFRRTVLRDGAVGVWGCLVLATASSVVLGTDFGSSGDGATSYGAPLVVIIAFVKVHLIGTYFMELRHAPLVLRVAFSAWVVGVGTTLLVLL